MKKKKNKTLRNVLIGATAVVAVGAIGTGLVLHYTHSKENGTNPDTSITIKPDTSTGTETVAKTYTSAQYLAMVNQYTQEIDGLKTELANSQEQYNQSLATYQAEITSLQQEIETLGEENAEQINEKNARIETIKAYIKTLEEEQNEKNADYEKQISDLNSLLSNYEKEILKTIKLPSDFVFTSLGFKIIENNDFVFYSSSHSCKLYYYHFDTETLETIPIKGTSFGSFYKLNNALYFVTSQMLYRYDFATQEIKILGSSSSIISYTYDANNLYVFDGCNGYGVLNFGTMKFDNYLSKDIYSCTVMKVDNYIFHTSYGSTPTKTSNHAHIRCFNTETQTDTVILENASYLKSFVKTDDGYFVCVDNGFYKFNNFTMELELIKDFGSSYNNCYVIEGKLVLFGYQGVYVYEDSTLTQLGTYGNNQVIPNFYKISDGIYYVTAQYLTGLWKLDLTNSTFTQLSSTYNNPKNAVDVGHYKLLGMDKGIYSIDMNTGTVENLAFQSNIGSYNKLKTIDCGNYIVFFTHSTSYKVTYAYVYYYDKTNDLFGQVCTGDFTVFSSLCDCLYKNGKLYVMTDSSLYIFDLSASLNNYSSKLTITQSLSNLQVGVFYSQVATLDDSNLYIKYTLLDDGSFDKELVVM